MQPILRIRKDAVSPVVAEILLVAITVVLAAVVYLMASGILMGHSQTRPVIAFAPGVTYASSSHNVTLQIAATSQNVNPYSYRFNMMVGAIGSGSGTYATPTVFAASGVPKNVTINGTTFQVTWIDVDGGGLVTQGDHIDVAGMGVSLPSNTGFEFLLLWDDGTTLATASWAT